MRYVLRATIEGLKLVDMVKDSMDAERQLWSRRPGLGVDTSSWPLPLVGAEINHVSPSSAHATESLSSNISPRLSLHAACGPGNDSQPCMQLGLDLGHSR